jgi:hypothetical protein
LRIGGQVNECNGDVTPTENYVKMRLMPTPRLRSIKGREFFCSLCETKFKARVPQPKQATFKDWEDPILKEWQSAVAETKAALLKEWDEHLHSAHPRQWEREQKKRARRRAKVNE